MEVRSGFYEPNASYASSESYASHSSSRSVKFFGQYFSVSHAGRLQTVTWREICPMGVISRHPQAFRRIWALCLWVLWRRLSALFVPACCLENKDVLHRYYIASYQLSGYGLFSLNCFEPCLMHDQIYGGCYSSRIALTGRSIPAIRTIVSSSTAYRAANWRPVVSEPS